MATTIGAGIGGAVGWGLESTYGTFPASINQFYEVTKAATTKTKKTAQSSGLASGRFIDLSARRALTSQAGTAQLDLEVMYSGHFGQLLKSVFGTTAAPVQQASSTAYLQTHTLLTLAGISATIQADIPDTSGVQHQYNFTGSKATGVTFSCGIDTFLTSSFTFDVMQVQETGALAAPSYPTLNPFHFAQSAVKWGTFGSEVAIDGVKKIDVKVERKQNVNRYYQGAAGLKREPITNDAVAITGTIESDYVNKTYFADVFASDTPQSLIWTFTGPIIASTYNYQFQIALPSVFIDSPGPQLDGKDIVSTSFAFTALNDGTNQPITLTYMSTDTTL